MSQPQCSVVRRGPCIPGTMRFEGINCQHPAAVRVLVRHGEDPEYRDLCLLHATAHLSPRVGAVRVPGGDWVETPPRAWFEA